MYKKVFATGENVLLTMGNYTNYVAHFELWVI